MTTPRAEQRALLLAFLRWERRYYERYGRAIPPYFHLEDLVEAFYAVQHASDASQLPDGSVLDSGYPREVTP